MQAPIERGAYCGRPGATIVAATAATCTNCKAAFRADERTAK